MPTQNIFISGSPALGDTAWNVWIAAGFSSVSTVTKIICPTSPELAFLFSSKHLVTNNQPLFFSEIESDIDLAVINEHDQNRFTASTQRIPLPKLDAYLHTSTTAQDPSEEGLHYLELVEQRIKAYVPSFQLMEPKPPSGLPSPEHILPKNWINKRFICINPGASHPFKKYPSEHWERLIKLLVRAGYQIVVLSGPEAAILKSPFWYSRRILNLQGKLSISESASLVARSDLHIAADTGFGHIASILKVPTITLFGSNIASTRCRPFGDRWITVQGRSLSPTDIQPQFIASLVTGSYRLSEEQQKFPLVNVGKQFDLRGSLRE